MKKLVLICGIVFMLSFAACGEGDDASREDAHDVPGSEVNKDGPYVMAFNNHYPNVESKCDESGHRIFVTSDGVLIVLPDPTCPGYVKGQEPAVVAPSN